jgi:hypothetical protein
MAKVSEVGSEETERKKVPSWILYFNSTGVPTSESPCQTSAAADCLTIIAIVLDSDVPDITTHGRKVRSSWMDLQLSDPELVHEWSKSQARQLEHYGQTINLDQTLSRRVDGKYKSEKQSATKLLIVTVGSGVISSLHCMEKRLYGREFEMYSVGIRHFRT